MSHENRAHALLSASSAHRWLNCPASARLEDGLADDPGIFALEGTRAHEVAEALLNYKLDGVRSSFDFTTDEAEAVGPYVDYVIDLYLAPYETCKQHWIEQRVNFDNYVPESYGTVDAAILTDNALTIVDLKFGRGLKVDADNNPQLRLYALGMLNVTDLLHEVEKVTVVIVQPRLGLISEETLTVSELRAWGDSIKMAAHEAYYGVPIQNPGEWCRFCKAAPFCKALADEVLATAANDFKTVASETTAEIDLEDLKKLYEKLPMVKSWAGAIEEYAKKRALEGEVMPGYKIVEGRSLRKWLNDSEVLEALESLGVAENEVVSKSLLSVAQLEKAKGKRFVSDNLGSYVVKNPGVPTLVPLNDKRRGLDASSDFED